MKKLLAAILGFVYLTFSCGATVHLHYCMGKLESWGLSTKNDAKCSFCGMHKDHNGCCHDEQKPVKIETDQKTAEFVLTFLIVCSDAVQLTFADLPVISSSIGIKNTISHVPRRCTTVPVFVLNCHFRI